MGQKCNRKKQLSYHISLCAMSIIYNFVDYSTVSKMVCCLFFFHRSIKCVQIICIRSNYYSHAQRFLGMADLMEKVIKKFKDPNFIRAYQNETNVWITQIRIYANIPRIHSSWFSNQKLLLTHAHTHTPTQMQHRCMLFEIEAKPNVYQRKPNENIPLTIYE